MTTTTSHAFSLALCLAASPLIAGDSRQVLAASLENCTELIGFGPVPLAAVQPLVPPRFQVVPIVPGNAGLVVRASSCSRVSLDGQGPEPVLVAQIGIAIASPDGTGDINNYSLLYVTNSKRLADALQDAGLPAQWDGAFAYEFTPNAAGSGELYVAVSPAGGPYFLTGNASPPPGPPSPVVANWWFAARESVVKMSTSIPGIAYGPSTAVLHTSKFTAIGNLIGGNTDAAFLFLNARGVFASGQLVVSIPR
jgi:hypothetical protein